MFSTEDRCLYTRHQLGEVICQLRFPEILSISVNPPAVFQDAIRSEFPKYQALRESPPPKISGAPGHLQLENPPATLNYLFSTPDGIWRVNLTSKFISLSCSHYTRWEDFARMLDKPLAAFIKVYQPSYFERVGIRYLNFISRKALELEETPFNQLISPCYLGPLAEEDVLQQAVNRCSVDIEMGIRGGCRAKIHAGPGMIKRPGLNDTEVKFIFDQDVYMSGNIPVNVSAGALQTIHVQADAIFRGAITDTLHEAMEPEAI